MRITGTAAVVDDRDLLQEIWVANPLLHHYVGELDNPDLIIYRIARELFDEARPDRRPVRLLGVAAGDLVAAATDGPSQGQLFGAAPESEDARKILEAMDQIREKFGDRAIRHGR